MIVALNVPSAAKSQRLTNFILYPSGNTILVKFSITYGNPCSGYRISRSTDSLIFNTLYEYTQTCGITNPTEDYTYTDYSPVAGKYNYYMVEIISPYEFAVKKAMLGTGGKIKIYAYPCPMSNYGGIINFNIPGSGNVELVGYVVNEYGSVVFNLDKQTVNDTMQVGIGVLTNGVYMTWLTDGVNIFYGKFIVWN